MSPFDERLDKLMGKTDGMSVAGAFIKRLREEVEEASPYDKDKVAAHLGRTPHDNVLQANDRFLNSTKFNKSPYDPAASATSTDFIRYGFMLRSFSDILNADELAIAAKHNNITFAYGSIGGKALGTIDGQQIDTLVYRASPIDDIGTLFFCTGGRACADASLAAVCGDIEQLGAGYDAAVHGRWYNLRTTKADKLDGEGLNVVRSYYGIFEKEAGFYVTRQLGVEPRLVSPENGQGPDQDERETLEMMEGFCASMYSCECDECDQRLAQRDFIRSTYGLGPAFDIRPDCKKQQTNKPATGGSSETDTPQAPIKQANSFVASTVN